MPSEGCGCVEPQEVGELLLAEAGALTVCHCTSTLRPRGRRVIDSREIAYFTTLVHGLRTGVALGGAPAPGVSRLRDSKEQALRALMQAYEEEGDVDGVDLCRQDLQVLERAVPLARVDGCVVANAPLLSAARELNCCLASEPFDVSEGVDGWGAAGTVATLTLFTSRGVVQVSTVEAVPVVKSSWRDAWVDAVLGGPELRRCGEPIAASNLNPTVHLMPTPPSSEPNPDTRQDAPSLAQSDALYRCSELAELLEQHIGAVRRGDEPPNLSDVRVTFIPVS